MPPTIPDPNPPTPEPEPTAVIVATPAPRAPGYVICDFCKCKLTRDGEIITMGEEARRFRDRRERETAADAEMQSLRDQLQTARTKLAEAEQMLREDTERNEPAARSDRI